MVLIHQIIFVWLLHNRWFNEEKYGEKAIKRKVTAYIRDNGIEEYADLIDTLMDSDEGDMYDIASQNTFFFTQYIKSKRNLKKQNN
mgnify:CR=1 FL=1